MCTNVVSLIIDFLKRESAPRWITSQALRSRLQMTQSVTEIESALLHFYNTTPNPEIRYSSLPSRKSLQVLWGHVDKVGHRKLFDIFKEDLHMEAHYLNDINDERTLFLSHSFKDTQKVFELARQLVTLDVNPWIAEADIEQHSNINSDVIRAIEDLPFFGIYLSEHVLESAWSAKEFGYAILNKKKLFAFVDAQDQPMIDLIEHHTPLKHLTVHDLLRDIFDRHDFSEDMDFFLIPNTKSAPQNYTRIKPLEIIRTTLFRL